MTISDKFIHRLARNILLQMDTPEEVADVVAVHLTESDLMGVRSHGILRLSKYIDQIRSGYIQNGAPITIKEHSASLIEIDCAKNFGIFAFHKLVPLLVERASQTGVAAGAIVNCAHTGRIGAFTEAAARKFMLGQIFGGGGNARLREVAPFGGAKAVYDTNPYAASLPIAGDDICTADFATSATAQGKMHVYRTNAKEVPDGWVIDKFGQPTRSAEDFYDGGALLPSGGHKGYGLAMIAELFGESVLGTPHELNWFMTVVDLKAFVQPEEYMVSAKRLKDKIADCPPQLGFERVMWPGQPEAIQRSLQTKNGIAYSDGEVQAIAEIAGRFGIPMEIG